MLRRCLLSVFKGPSALGACIVAALLATGPIHAEPGVHPDKVVFGQSAAFEGPARALGLGMREGILAAFHEVNSAGGVKGRRLELVSYDDGYEPDRAIANTKRLIHEDEVFALIGEVGTPTSKAAQPIASDEQVPFIGPFTGAEFLRNPYKRTVINVRGSYYQETEAMVERLTQDLGITRVAILYQDDSYGRAGLAGVERALRQRAMELVAEGTYMRNTIAVKTAVLAIRKGDPEAVIMIGAYKPCAEFIRVARQIDFDPLFLNVSFVGSKALAGELGSAGEGVIVTQVVPFPENTTIPLVAQYQKALKAFNPIAEPGFVSLEGYMVGRLAVKALHELEGAISREAFLETFVKVGTFELGGVELTYGPNDNQGMDRVFFTVIQGDGTLRRIDKLETQSIPERSAAR
ncbi:MAG: ABC transporter substrate-binding protein [Gammaproteobacteria bacterium]|nr:ABC transporter substrate-binding protein [Gammaproteobacteria bacterium]NIR81719.1 ABC transporter substrate-binding protein [Gammaproteobacteria bacterium]NIR88522.1 ABC transporter substrate-binding protein [Gammaproteobacteria bacterium]NIU02826.1 ABC transporter substrate-binding protein [Gammaproteobacteria bacterium]NIV50348.1 ABC transporter substrate-binding protein [Gammaproteobacteria bacterium]